MTEPDARRRLYGRYVKARWLGWLAAALSNRNQIPFALEDLDPTWLPSRPLQRAGKWVAGLVAGLVGGLVFGLVSVFVAGLVVNVFYGLVFGLCGVLGVLVHEWGPVDSLNIDRSRLRGGFVVGLFQGVFVAWLYGDLLIGLFVGLFGGLFVGLFEVLRPAAVSERSTANEGTRRSLRYALYFASAGVVLSLLFTWGVYVLGDSLNAANIGMADQVLTSVPAIAWAGMYLGLFKGGYFALRHGVVRALLHRLDLAPWAYVSFLDEAKDHLFLRKTGGVYQFFHVTFRDFMAETYGADWLAEPPPPDPATLPADAS